ncbi:MAG: hypothetical protein QM731_00690 [Chitinophagaceae bacterium]
MAFIEKKVPQTPKSMKREKLSLLVLAVEIAAIALLHTAKVSNDAQHTQVTAEKTSATAAVKNVNSFFTLVSFK